MGTSTRYSSASELAKNEDKPDIADASGSSPISANNNPELLAAIARVEQSLRTVLTHILTIQRKMGLAKNEDINTPLVQPAPATAGVPLKPDDTWNGTP